MNTPERRQIPRVLSIAGTDPSGGAGIQADLKSIAALGGYGMAVITALVAQNTRGVRSVHTPPSSFLLEQLQAVSDDVAIDAVKIGMLGGVETIDTVRAWLAQVRPPLVVLDPVMIATSGDRLLDGDAEAALRALLPLVDLVTPNLPELAVLVQEPVAAGWAEAKEQGLRLSKSAGVAVLVKGGHLGGADSPDALVDAANVEGEQVLEFDSVRIQTNNTHGTGCSLSAALATVQARRGDWSASVAEVKEWLQEALRHADELEVGAGNGPVNHFHRLWSTAAPAAELPGGRLWTGTAALREQIYGLGFITALADGTLSEGDFGYYLHEDAKYLREYSRALARASQLAPTEAEQLFWASASRTSIEVEAQLHRDWLSQGWLAQRPGLCADPGPVTKAYTDHLTATGAGGSYAVLVAALLPCYWLYADIGESLHAGYLAGSDPQAHPYAAWLQTYADEAFAEATRQAVGIMDRAAQAASGAERKRMRTAFLDSARYELAFFDAPRLYNKEN